MSVFLSQRKMKMFYQPKNGHGLKHDPFKAIVSPRPIGWIATRDKKRNVNLAPYSFFNAIADDPPMVIFCANGDKDLNTKLKDSVSNIRQTGEFVVNIVSEKLIQKMNLSSGVYPNETDEFVLADLKKGKSKIIDVPLVLESPACLECQLFKFQKLPGRSNLLVIGEVVGVHINENYLTNGLFDILTYYPVARLGYRDYTIVKNTFSLNRPNQK